LLRPSSTLKSSTVIGSWPGHAAAATASDSRIAKLSQSTISVLANERFERGIAESWRPNASGKSDIGENRRPLAAVVLDRIDYADKFPGVAPSPNIPN
jgi:hypothetical protein